MCPEISNPDGGQLEHLKWPNGMPLEVQRRLMETDHQTAANILSQIRGSG